MALKLSHRQAIAVMVLTTLLWSIAGVVSRQMTHAQGFEVTFWRSFFTVLSLSVLLPVIKGRRLWQELPWRQKRFWLSGWCWATMFTAFMMGLSLTSALAKHTWLAIALAGAGMVFMFISQVQIDGAQHLWGMAVALCVPIAGAVQWNLTHHLQSSDQPRDYMPAVWVGAALSSLITAPLALPGMASASDIAWLACLGLFQLAVPCLLAVWAARVLQSHEVALLALLEVVFGIAWAWWGAGEEPALTVLAGGTLVLGALAWNEWVSWRVAND